MTVKPETRIMRALTSKKKYNTEEASVLQQEGQNAYRSGDFQGAIRSFTQALAANPEDAGTYDNRAATYCKLKQYGQARTDARAMVKLSPHEDRGYLRLGKVLCLDGSFDKALTVYEYALQKLPADHSGREIIGKLLKKLQDKLAGGNRRDPFTVLPLELAELTLGSFSFKQILKLLLVCKSWHRFLSGLTSLWMNVDLTGAKKSVPWTSIRNYIHRSRVQLTRATITNIASSATPKVLDMLSRCPNLEHLSLLVPHVEVNEFYPKIKEFRNLRSITCGSDINLPHPYVGAILTHLPKLEKASFARVWDTHARSLTPSAWPQNLPNLKSLTIASGQEARRGMDFQYLDVVPGLGSSVYPNLEELRLAWYPALADSFRFNPVQEDESLPPLRELELRGAVLQPNFYSILPTSLESLRVDSGSIEREHYTFPQLLLPGENELPNLKTLIVNDAPWVDPSNLSILMMHSKAPLRTVSVNACQGMHVTDFIGVLSDPGGKNPEVENIIEVGAACMVGMDDLAVQNLCSILPHLEILDVSQTAITGCTIRMLADSREHDSDGSKLHTLIIKKCDLVSRDAIDYGRQMGLTIIAQ